MGQETWTVKKTRTFERWLRRLKDQDARAAITARIRRWQVGLFGDVRALGEGLFEMRIDIGPGYRVYGLQAAHAVVLLLCGGSKGSQVRDIARAKRMAAQVKVGGSNEKPF